MKTTKTIAKPENILDKRKILRQKIFDSFKSLKEKYRIEFKKELKDNIYNNKEISNEELEIYEKILENISNFKENKLSLNSLKRDIFSGLTEEQLKSLKIEYTVLTKSKNPENYKNHYIYKISSLKKVKTLYYLLVPTILNKKLSYCGFIFYEKQVYAVWGDGSPKLEIKKSNHNLIQNLI